MPLIELTIAIEPRQVLDDFGGLVHAEAPAQVLGQSL